MVCGRMKKICMKNNMLEKKGIDSIEISKNIDGSFNINFKGIDTYEDFKREYK